ncbi:hypothetical protein A1O3_05923 [Capronia epimyces CBS 606.96]|uniref:Xylanolytic transcriptional activator regulatory domain-containing protein n=1 Tax=Capronia epimyces CBS 606.96 TaxID=1182542 RepID=W9XYB1_9EURO|nr:uncharacterized protein A1O3_05923 [Capronia epimyces CBS 606.96]EXJ85248.1 hypothetical protein A1O3_05923 [Capronia epimyces CBS 606.96]
MLVFHQEDFRSRFDRLYDIRHDLQLVTKNGLVGFTSTLLASFAITLQHAGAYRKNILRRAGVDPETLKENILTTLRVRFLDVLSLGSLEVVQTCVLLGSYYLYYGRPELSWPICGCGLRVAQALNLHRKLATSDSTSRSPGSQSNEVRKRTWWAVYEIETICSMLYGYPLTISEHDCDVETLDPHADQQNYRPSPLARDSSINVATLLSYKYFMSKLLMIVRAGLTDLYHVHQHPANPGTSSANRTTRLQQLIYQVAELDDRLRHWHQELPPTLRLENVEASASSYHLREEIDADIGASGARFESHIFQLQALALSLAFENARILVHRPLLSYKIIPPAPTDPQGKGMATFPSSAASNPFQRSIQACREAALRTSAVGSTPIFHYASTTYAAAFFGMHLFTAGVTLCILASLAPLSMQSQEAKIGVHRLLEMQLSLKESSNLAAQSHRILKNLADLILQKEKEKMFEFSALEEAAQTVPIVDGWPEHSRKDIGESLPRISDASAATVETQDNASLPATGDLGETSIFNPDYGIIDFDFDENPSVTNMLLDLEQAMYDSSGDTTVPDNGLSNLSSHPTGNDYIEQEGWIWGVDFFPGANG